MNTKYIHNLLVVTSVIALVVLLPLFAFASDYTKNDITELTAEVVNRTEKKWKFEVTFSDEKTDSIIIRDIGGKYTLYEEIAEALIDKYEFSISDDDVQDIIVFDESDFGGEAEIPTVIHTDASTGIAKRWQVEVEYENQDNNTTFYVYGIETTTDLFEEVARRLDISPDSVKGVIDYDKDVLSDTEEIDTTIRKIIATPDVLVDYKWEVVFEYRDRTIPNKTFIAYGVFSTGDLILAIQQEAEIDAEEIAEVLQVREKEEPQQEEDKEEEQEQEVEEEEEEVQEEKEPVRIYAASEITTVELYAQGTSPESYSIKVLTSDGVTTDIRGVVADERSEKDFFNNVARKINTKANFRNLDGYDINKLSVFTLTDTQQEEKDFEENAIQALLLLVIELLSASDDEDLQERISDLLQQID